MFEEDNDATGVSTEGTGAPGSADLDNQNAKQQQDAPDTRGAEPKEQPVPTEEGDLTEDPINAESTRKYRKSDEEVLDQLDRMEAKLDQVIEMLTPGAQTSAKVPYVAPEQPAGLSPNQILATAQAISQAGAE